MVNVVQRTLALLEAEEILRGGGQVFLGQNARVTALDAELLVDFVTTYATQIVTLGIEKQTFDERARVGGGRRIAGTQTAVNILERLFLVLGGILLHALDDDPFVNRSVHDTDFADAEFGNLFHDRLGQRLKGARDHEIFFRVNRVFDQNLVRQIVELFRFLDGEFFDLVKEFQDFLVRAASLVTVLVLALAFDGEKTQRAEQRGRQKFPAAFLAVEINVKQIARVELRLIPRTAIRDDAERMKHFAVWVLRG